MFNPRFNGDHFLIFPGRIRSCYWYKRLLRLFKPPLCRTWLCFACLHPKDDHSSITNDHSPVHRAHSCLLAIPQQPGGERAQLHPSPCLLLTALVAIHPLSSCTITDGGNNIASTGYHNNRPQHPVQTALASHHAPSAGLREAVSAVVIYFTRYHHHGHGGTFLRLFGLSIEWGRWPLWKY